MANQVKLRQKIGSRVYSFSEFSTSSKIHQHMYQALFLGPYYFCIGGLFTSPLFSNRSHSSSLFFFLASKHLDCMRGKWKYQVPGDTCQSGQVVPLHLRLVALLQGESAEPQLNRGSLNHGKSAGMVHSPGY